jgi:AcrR family transcriptional regulator
LLDAASAVLLDRGFHGTRVDDVVGAAGLSRGSFYRHFETKNHLFYALAERAASRTVERLDAWPADDDAEALRRWLGEWFDAYRADGGVISAWQEIDYGDPALAQYAMAMAGMVLDRLRAIVSRRRFGDASVDGVALLSIIEGVPYSVFVRGALDERVAIDAASFVIRRGLLGVDGQAAARSLTRTSRAKLPPMILALPASSNPAKRST